jgi:hypothetical protein
VRAVWLLLVITACGPRSGPVLSAAGSPSDDGVGVLARMSAKLELAGAADDDTVAYDDSNDRYARQEQTDPLMYSGYTYGGFGYGGFGYGGMSYGASAMGVGFFPSTPPPPPRYETLSIGDPGLITGTVHWRSSGGVSWPPDCALARTAIANAATVGAVVYLDQVDAGRAPVGRSDGIVTVTPCGVAPAVQLISPVPGLVIIESRAGATARITLSGGGADERFDIDPGGRAQTPVSRAGLLRFAGDGGAPAWGFALPHPYYAITDDSGQFSIDQVPPGPHTLVVWYPPMVTAIGVDGPVWSVPSEERRSIVVGLSGVVIVPVSLTPAR